jgi:phage-related protein
VTPDTLVKPVSWIGSSYKDFRSFPDPVQDAMGFALYQAQIGGKHISAKALKGFGGAGVLEIVTDHMGDTFRAVYTVKFATAIYVLHAFQKKSKSGIKTPTEDVELIQRRLKAAAADYKILLGKGKAS